MIRKPDTLLMAKLLLLLAFGAHVALVTSGPDPSKTSVSADNAAQSSSTVDSDGNAEYTEIQQTKNANCKKGDAKCGYRPHEKYVECADNLCGPQYCYEVGFQRNCPEVKPGCCSKSPGCYCEEGYVRDTTGKCIDARKCPRCGYDENSQSGCGKNCGRLCSNWNSTEPIFCTKECNLDGCDCKKGYVYDENTNQCVKPDQCTALCTKPNTEFSSCANGVCYIAKTCEDLATSNGTIICPSVKVCTPGCICKDGYILDKKGNCIPENQCPCAKCKGANETYSLCPDTLCGPKCCSDVGIPNLSNCQPRENGDCPGKPGCVCRNGFLYDSNGVCIPTSECPSCGPNGDKNATSGCGSNCGRRCSSYWKSSRMVCPLLCRFNSCDCKEGYVIDDNTGFCVEKQDCTKVCGQNEEYSYCANGGCWRAKKCSEFKDEEEYNNLPLKCARPAQCIPDCICKDGYVKNQNGVCVLPKECKDNKKCKGCHEFYDPCADPCETQKCSEIDRYLNNCVAPPEGAPCKGACRCAAGYYRDDKGCCILEQQCPKYCPPQCETDEVYDDCINGGCIDPRTCATMGDPTKCVDLIQGGCKGGCKCREGFLRNKDGKCVPKYQCPPRTCPNKDEVWDNCINGGCRGPLNCNELAERGNSTICFKLAEGSCQGGCKCKKDWVRNDKGVCVPQNKCPSAPCKENEELNKCPGTCPLKRCGFNDRLVFCPKQPVVGDKNCLPPACTCKSGYYRNDQGKCVEWEQCSKCSVNEVFDKCSIRCPPRECGVNIAAVTCLRVSDSTCVAECRCKDGFLRNSNGRCVAESECPPPLDQNICKTNEVFVPCLNPCPTQECSVNPAVIKCAKPPEVGDPNCTPGCRCIDGYARNDARLCIPREECPNDKVKCTGANEEWVSCSSPCDRNTCESIDKLLPCPRQHLEKRVCKGQCKCKSGYYRNKIGQCILKEDCLKCTKPHEFFACGGACDNICSHLGQYNQSICHIINIQCNRMCYCETGYARDIFGNCVPISECRSCPGEHEWNNTCASNYPPDTCSSFGKPYQTPISLTPPKDCKAACVCEDDYSRDANGKCIPRKDCPCGDGSDPNAVIGGGCGVPCDRYCSTYNSSVPIACTEQCKNECDCKPGYVYDEIAKRCTLPEKCTPTSCPKNEVVSTCVEGYCTQQECSKKDEPFPCPDVMPGGCSSGCLCKPGYFRDTNGNCIPEDQCPSKCGKNARISTCIQATCRPLTCDQRGKPVPCPKIRKRCCKVGCVCDKGYLKDKNGNCIPEKDCPCENGGIWTTCPAQPCPADNCPKSRNDPQDCRSTKNCGRPRCTCGFNQKLDRKTGKCIPIRDCPPFPCGENETYNACPFCIKENCTNYVNNDTTCHFIGKIGIVLRCTPKCVCIKGYFRNSEGKCIKAKQCPKACPNKDEVWDDCMNGGCRGPLTCNELAERGNNTICIKLAAGACRGGCKCKKDWVRNDKGICVPQNQCPIKCKGANVRWVSCPKPCDPNTCESIGKRLHCPRQPFIKRPCKGQCKCIQGYYRNKIGECIKKEDCLKCTKPHEYFSCGGACDNICSRLGQYNQSNCNIKNVKCNRMCYCEAGYARDGFGNCVPISKCRSCPGKHEWNNTCASDCPPDTCNSFGKVYHCPLSLIPPKGCKAACRCEDDYSRDANGTCIPRKDCPCGDGSDPNAVIGGGCGVPCDRYCSTYNSSEPVFCTAECKNECDCKPGYVYDEIAKRCTLPKKCTPKSCSCDGEEVSTCVEAICRQQECSKKDEPVSCPDLAPGACSSGCVCKKDYYRDAKGICVPEKQCPNSCGKER